MSTFHPPIERVDRDVIGPAPGLDDGGEDAVLLQVLAASQQEYLDSLKQREEEAGEAGQQEDKKE